MEKIFPKGSIIAKAHDQNSKELFVVLQGSVGVYSDWGQANPTQTAVLSPGSYYGELSIFLNKTREHTLVSLGDSMVKIINRRMLPEFFSKQPDFAIKFVESICKNLDTAQKSLEQYNLAKASQEASRNSTLFPEGHGNYTLPINNANELLYEDKIICPLCAHNFVNMTIIGSRLKPIGTDDDMRVRYKDIEPLHYDIITCPSCFYSATTTQFPTLSKKSAENINAAVGPHILDMYITSGTKRDTFTVFAGYYLAMLCAQSFDNPQMLTANLWLKLSRIYQDCEDTEMYLYASKRSLDDFSHCYQYQNIQGKQLQNMVYIMGDLCQRVGELTRAREYFFMAKTDKEGTPVIARKADLRLDKIRDLIKAAENPATT